MIDLLQHNLLKLVYQAHEENGTLDVSAFPADADLKLKNVVSIFAERSEGTG